jgi:ankyrin repeat protein
MPTITSFQAFAMRGVYLGLLPSLTVGLAMVSISGCQSSSSKGSIPFQPLLDDVRGELVVARLVSQLTVSDELPSSSLPLNEQLVNAVQTNDWTAAKALLNEGAGADAGDFVTGYALPIAAANNNLPMVKLLLENGADVNIAGDEGYTALAEAMSTGDPDLVAYLLQQGADPNALAAGLTPLMMAIQQGRPDLVELLLQQGAKPTDAAGQSLLEFTAESRQTALADYDAITELLTNAEAR